jgi:nucleotide-binding universal stress UspA family protein
MHPTESSSKPFRVFLSASQPEFLEPAVGFVRGLSDSVIEVKQVPFEEFGTVRDRVDDATSDVVVVAVEANEEGQVDTKSRLMQTALDSDIPFMVLRAEVGKVPAFTPVKRIVVPLDGSDTSAQAIPVASRLARYAGLPVRFVMVIDPSRVIPAAFAYDPEAWGVISDLRQTAHWALRQAEDRMRHEGIAVESDLLYGPVNACLSEIIQDGDVVVMTTHGSGRAAIRKVGSVAERVLASVPQPIVIKRATIQGDVVVEGYEACSWVEPLMRPARV